MNKERWIERAKELGIDELEIYEQLTESRSLSWFGGKMDSFTTSRVLGTSLRAIVGGKQAEMALEQADDAQMDEILSSLAEQGRIVSSSDPAALRAPEKTDEVKSRKNFVKPSVEAIREAPSARPAEEITSGAGVPGGAVEGSAVIAYIVRWCAVKRRRASSASSPKSLKRAFARARMSGRTTEGVKPLNWG